MAEQASIPRDALAGLPSVDRLLQSQPVAALCAQFGRPLVLEQLRKRLNQQRRAVREGEAPAVWSDADFATDCMQAIERLLSPSQRPVFNLTGTVLHTNLGRAPLPQTAIEAVVSISSGASSLEFDLETGRRGDRDAHVEDWLRRLTGAEAATVVNNNAAAVFLMLNTLALRKEVPVSRGELVEIGGAFRVPDIMARAGCRLREVGTTNRTHLRDFEQAITPRTAMLLKVHTSNYAIQGFTKAVSERDLADLAHGHGLPFVIDLGSGTLADLRRFGLPHEPTPAEALANGADLLSFSGDKLLGGPQAGLIVGRADLIARIKRNPLKRALRTDKMTLAALEAVLRLYADPDSLGEHLPALRLLTRPISDIHTQAQRLAPRLQEALQDLASVSVMGCQSQIGSGSLPVDLLPSACLAIRPVGRSRGRALSHLAKKLRELAMPVIGRVQDDMLLLDLRCLERAMEERFLEQLSILKARITPP